MLKEIEICEILRKHPHSNIATYYGCCADHGRASALYFKLYTSTLHEIVNPQMLNKRMFSSSTRRLVNGSLKDKLDQLLEGIQLLHTIGLVHNDITPANIILDEDTGSLVLIDFDSCRSIGESLSGTATKRTHEWHNPDVDISSRENDLQAFLELKT